MKDIFENHSVLVENGITYNTATADPVATEVVCENITRTLCRTRRGKWFFYAQDENIAVGIQPVTAVGAVVWLHSQGLPYLIGKYFPDLLDVRDLTMGRVVAPPAQVRWVADDPSGEAGMNL